MGDDVILTINTRFLLVEPPCLATEQVKLASWNTAIISLVVQSVSQSYKMSHVGPIGLHPTYMFLLIMDFKLIMWNNNVCMVYNSPVFK